MNINLLHHVADLGVLFNLAWLFAYSVKWSPFLLFLAFVVLIF